MGGPCKVCNTYTLTRCQSCFEQYPQDKPTYYCSKRCRKFDREDHKPLCEARQVRKQLHRAGRLVQDVFYQYREQAWDLPIAAVDKRGESLTLWLGRPSGGGKGEEDEELTEGDFPHALVPVENDKKALLAWLQGKDAIAHMAALVGLCMQTPPPETKHQRRKRWLEKLCRPFRTVPSLLKHHVLDASDAQSSELCLGEAVYKIEEMVLILKPYPRRVVFDPPFEMPVELIHEVFRVTLKNGKAFAFDITGAQYGHYAPTVPWMDYCTRYKRIIEANEVGAAAGMLALFQESRKHVSGRQWVRLERNRLVVDIVNAAITMFVSCNRKLVGGSLSEMLRLPDGVYEHCRGRLLRTVENEVDAFLTEAYSRELEFQCRENV